MSTSFELKFEILSDWHIGSGEEGGSYADALVLKDNQGIAYLPGRSVKGLLREAVSLAQDNGWFEEDLVTQLFGSEGKELTTQGNILVSSATLVDSEYAFLIANPEAKKHLYRTLHSTAIDAETGSAKCTSLRAIEVVIPMTLVSTITLVDGNDKHQKAIKDALPLIANFGAKRHRGLGQALVSLQRKGAQ